MIFCRNKKGFSIIELIIVIGIIASLGMMGLVSFTGLRNRSQLTSSGQEALSVLRTAQAKTLAQEEGFSWGVHLASDKFILFKGTDFSASTTTQEYILPSILEIADINLNGGGQDVLFNKITGATGQYGTFSVQVKNSPSTKIPIAIDQSGKIYQASSVEAPMGTRIADTRHRNFDLGWSIKNSSALLLVFSDSPNPDTEVSVPMASFFNSDKTSFDWSGKILIGGSNQVLRIHTISLTDTDTILSVDRDCRYNNKILQISIDGKDIASYSADCQLIILGTYGGSPSEP